MDFAALTQGAWRTDSIGAAAALGIVVGLTASRWDSRRAGDVVPVVERPPRPLPMAGGAGPAASRSASPWEKRVADGGSPSWI